MKITRGGVAQTVVAVVGAWLMVAPAVLGHSGSTLSSSDRIVGPVVLAVGFLGIFPITRILRFLNLLPGAWLLAAPFLLSGGGTAATVSDVVSGLVVLALATVERAPQDQYGGGWDTLVKPERLPRA